MTVKYNFARKKEIIIVYFIRFMVRDNSRVINHGDAALKPIV